MPEFILDTAGRVPIAHAEHIMGATLAFDNLDAFTQGYIEALFFTSECPQVDTEEFWTPEFQEDMREGRADGVLPCDVGFGDLSPEALQSIIADCRDFQEANAALLGQAYETVREYTCGHYDPTYDASQAGRDFWFTRNGHGVGFWDRGLGEVGEKLSKACGRTEIDPYFGEDGRVHLD